MNLHCAPNTISVAVAIALDEAGLAYTQTVLDMAQGDQAQAPYLAINPKGRVPTLEVDGTYLTETGAILEFIGGLAPALLPNDAMQAAQMRSVMYYLASTMHINHAHKKRGHRWADLDASKADMTTKVPETMAASAQFLEDHVLLGPFTMGDGLTLVDPYLFVVCNWLPGDGVDMVPFPKLRAFMDVMETRPSVQAVRAQGLLT